MVFRHTFGNFAFCEAKSDDDLEIVDATRVLFLCYEVS